MMCDIINWTLFFERRIKAKNTKRWRVKKWVQRIGYFVVFILASGKQNDIEQESEAAEKRRKYVFNKLNNAYLKAEKSFFKYVVKVWSIEIKQDII